MVQKSSGLLVTTAILILPESRLHEGRQKANAAAAIRSERRERNIGVAGSVGRRVADTIREMNCPARSDHHRVTEGTEKIFDLCLLCALCDSVVSFQN